MHALKKQAGNFLSHEVFFVFLFFVFFRGGGDGYVERNSKRRTSQISRCELKKGKRQLFRTSMPLMAAAPALRLSWRGRTRISARPSVRLRPPPLSSGLILATRTFATGPGRVLEGCTSSAIPAVRRGANFYSLRDQLYLHLSLAQTPFFLPSSPPLLPSPLPGPLSLSLPSPPLPLIPSPARRHRPLLRLSSL